MQPTIKIYTKDIFLSKEAQEKMKAEEGDSLLVNFDEEEGIIELAIAPRLDGKDGFLLSNNNGALRTGNNLIRKIPKGDYSIGDASFDGSVDWFELEKATVRP